MRRAALVTLVLSGFAMGIAAAQAPQQAPPAKEDEHKASIHGIEVGMNAQQVLDQMGGRMPDARKDEKDGFIVQWKLENGSVLRATFHQENVADIFIQYKPPIPTQDLNLVAQFSPASRTGLTASDPRLRRDYKATQTDDLQRTVWERDEKMPGGYRVQVRFLSVAKKQAGDRYEESVEFKYVTLLKDDLKKFEAAVAGGPKQ